MLFSKQKFNDIKPIHRLTPKTLYSITLLVACIDLNLPELICDLKINMQMVKRLSANAMETVVEIDLIKGDSG
jgi:hypothetical protein